MTKEQTINIKIIKPEILHNLSFTSYKWFAKMSSSTMYAEMYCEENKMYFIDSEGDIHYFEYLGTNLAQNSR
jgi:hypothetical protein